MDDKDALKLPSTQIEEMKYNAFKHERIIYIFEDITKETEFIVNRRLDKLVNADIAYGAIRPIHIHISTEGGSVFSTLSIISKIEELKDMGYIINAKTYGDCMSGGLFILMCCSNRVSQRHTEFLLHQVQGFEFGHTTVESTKRSLKNMSDLWTRARDLTKKYTLVTDEFLDDITKNDIDYYFWPEEALELGFIDKIE